MLSAEVTAVAGGCFRFLVALGGLDDAAAGC